MILDYSFNKNKRILSISYIKDNGLKDIMNFNVDRFKSFYPDKSGKYTNWDGTPCSIKWTDRPDKFDIKTYIEELNEQYKSKLQGKTSPKLYTWDIEVVSDEFPNASEAKYPIVTISVCSPDCNVIIMGTRPLGNNGDEYLSSNFSNYISKMDYFKKTGLKMPSIKYMEFDCEKDMLIYFLKNIVSKVPVLAGWNSMLFDWQYVQNRIKGYYPDINLSICSCNETLEYKNYTDMVGNKIRLSIPTHTVMLDMMDVIGTFDFVVLPIKESLSLDYIAYETLGVNKIEYEGTLSDLYYGDYQKYVYYNAIDSVLVQLIDKRFKTLQNIYTQALYCREKIGLAFSKIAISEALVFNYFYDKGIKIIPDRTKDVERGTLVGAYVRIPTPGKHNYVCCNDFASLYPSTIITCNMSFENFVGTYYNEDELIKYKEDQSKYIVVGGNVYKNDGTIDKPSLGDMICRCLDEKTLDIYRKDKNYFVSVNGHVYKNDKDYSFKIIQATLKANRNTFKYLAKGLEADVMSDIEHILKGHKPENKNYSNDKIKVMSDIGYNVTCTNDLYNITDIKEFTSKLKNEIEFYTSYEQAMKNLGNSMYGGSSHISFFWFNMSMANDITGEAKNVIKLMEEHIPEYIKNEWPKMKDVHKELGITVNEEKAKEILKCNDSFVKVIYGDTDSLYISYENLVKTIDGYEKMTPAEKGKIVVEFNTKYLDAHNREIMAKHYEDRFVKSVQNFELETLALSGVWLNVKKRYAQVLLWKDGKTFSTEDGLPMKAKGLELIKASYPKQTREGLKRLVRFLLESDEDNNYLLHQLNVKMQQEKQAYFNADIDDICASMKINGYTKYIVDDNNPNGLITMPKCPPNVKAAGNYNRIRQLNNLPGDPIYGGKVKYFVYYPTVATKKDSLEYFAYQAKNYPKWADTYAPIAKGIMFQKFTLDPFNRIIEAIGLGTLNLDGSIQMGLNLF